MLRVAVRFSAPRRWVPSGRLRPHAVGPGRGARRRRARGARHHVGGRTEHERLIARLVRGVSTGSISLLGLITAGSSLLWPALVGYFTGSADAYERTQAAWRSGGVVQPFKQSIGIAH
jgi:hypothetical protein